MNKEDLENKTVTYEYRGERFIALVIEHNGMYVIVQDQYNITADHRIQWKPRVMHIEKNKVRKYRV